MNGYLVVLRCGCDDLPVHLYAADQQQEAKQHAEKIAKHYKNQMEVAFGYHWQHLPEVDAALNVLRTDVSILCNASVFEFRGGALVSSECFDIGS